MSPEFSGPRKTRQTSCMPDTFRKVQNIEKIIFSITSLPSLLTHSLTSRKYYLAFIRKHEVNFAGLIKVSTTAEQKKRWDTRTASTALSTSGLVCPTVIF